MLTYINGYRRNLSTSYLLQKAKNTRKKLIQHINYRDETLRSVNKS